MKTLAPLPPALPHKHEVVFKRWEESRTTAEGPQKELPKRLPCSELRGRGSPLVPATPPPRPGTELRGLQERSGTRAAAGARPDPGVRGARLPPRERASAASTAEGLKPLRTQEARTWRSRSNRPSAWRPRYTGETHVRPLGSQSGSAEQFLKRERSIRPAGTSSRLLPPSYRCVLLGDPPPSPGASSK